MRELKDGIFYTELDSLFDTRLATLMTMGVDFVDKAISDGYYGRLVDEFNFVDNAEFRKKLASGDKNILKQSLVTPILRLINTFIRQSLNSVVSSPVPIQPIIEVNSYPYQLTEEEANEIIIGLRAATQDLASIRIVNIATKDLTPEHVNNNYIQMAMYSYWNWLNVQFEQRNFDKHRCPGVVVFGPAILKDENAKRIFKNTDVFSSIEKYFSPFIKLTLIHTNYFSVDLKRVAKAKKQSE